MTKTVKKEAFEPLLEKLESIVHELESGEKGLEDSLELFEKGLVLAKDLSTRLREAKQKVEVLTQEGGKLVRKEAPRKPSDRRLGRSPFRGAAEAAGRPARGCLPRHAPAPLLAQRGPAPDRRGPRLPARGRPAKSAAKVRDGGAVLIRYPRREEPPPAASPTRLPILL